MPTGAITHTLLEAQDIHLNADFRDATARRRPTPPGVRAAPHDFLIVCVHPDLTPGFLPVLGAHR